MKVLEKIGKDLEVLKIIRQRQMRFFGHIWRQDGIERMVTSGYIEGKRACGGQRLTYTNSLRKDTCGLKNNVDI